MSASLYASTKRNAERVIGWAKAAHGHAYLGVCIDAVLDAMGEYLAKDHGPEKAFEYFTRAAEKAIAPRLRPQAKAE